MFSFIFDAFVGLKAKLIGAAVAVLMFFLWITKIKHDARKQGRADVKKEINKETKKVENAWTEIDHRPASVDDALGRLRKRSTDSGYGP